ncbi:hypothetical protein ABLE91_07120 [Aquabacter sp. CN5-332]|uniref:hypothetical protein n=1 Tax=Aquabacter sp. CN5-332 TaxID=3156608 RepID=UPI0032B5F1AC
MFGYGSRTATSDIAHRIENLRTEIALLGEALADAAEEQSRGPRRRARRFAHDAAESLTSHAEELGAQAGALASSGLSAALKGRRQMMRELDGAAARTQEVVTRHPAAVLVAALGVGLVAACVLSLAAQTPRHRGASPGGIVRRPRA